MPGGRVPPQLLITSRCGGWFEQKEKDTRTVWPPQPAGMNRRLRRAKAPSASYCSLFFPASVPRPDSPWRTEMKTCRLSPPAPPWCVEAWLSLGPSNFTEFHLSSALPPHPTPARPAFYCSPLLGVCSPSLRFLPTLNVVFPEDTRFSNTSSDP